MGNQQPKGLLTSLVLFITVGLFSLATLFTLLILEVRSGQQQLNQQLAQLTGVPITAATSNTSIDPSIDPLQLSQMQATLELIAFRQQRTLSTDPYASQLHTLTEKVEQLLSLIESQPESHPVETTVTALLPESLKLSLSQISSGVLLQQQQSSQQEEMLYALSTQGTTQQQQIRSNQQLLRQLLERPTPTTVATVDEQPLKSIEQKLEALTRQQRPNSQQTQLLQSLAEQTRALQDQVALNQQLILQNQPPSPSLEVVESPSLKEINQRLGKMALQQQKIEKAQQQLSQLNQKLLTASSSPSSPQQKSTLGALTTLEHKLDQLSQEQRLIQQTQQRLEELTQTIIKQQQKRSTATTAAATPATAPLSPAVLEQLNRQLHQLTEQQQQIERNLMKPMERSNTIKPYSYRAR